MPRPHGLAPACHERVGPAGGFRAAEHNPARRSSLKAPGRWLTFVVPVVEPMGPRPAVAGSLGHGARVHRHPCRSLERRRPPAEAACGIVGHPRVRAHLMSATQARGARHDSPSATNSKTGRPALGRPRSSSRGAQRRPPASRCRPKDDSMHRLWTSLMAGHDPALPQLRSLRHLQ